jgi:hypothetical protein
MHDLSFDPRDPVFEFGGYKFSIQISTFENIYGIDPQKCSANLASDGLRVHADGLRWAGGQEQSAGTVTVHARQSGGDPERISFAVQASAERRIRCIKLVIKNVAAHAVVNLRETPERVIPNTGLIYKYPDGWRGLYTPLIVLQTTDGRLLYFRSLDEQVRQKTFALVPRAKGFDVEMIFEERATAMDNTITAPLWEIGTCSSVEEIMGEHRTHVERAYGLQTWEERADVPAWGRKISLIAAIHCQHNTGYIFNDYAKALATLEWIGREIDPSQVLVYLPGWEGRYYWQYGDYRPDPRMGGAEGFARLCKGAKAMGFHISPMFGSNIVNRGLENFEQWGAPALHLTAGGFTQSGSVDWDSSRHYDHGWAAMVNPAIPTWQNRLVGQIRGLIDQYEFDSLFLDISAAYWNDPRADVYFGMRQMIERLREGHPELLVTGEGWFDAMTALTPITQVGHTDGVIHWSDDPVPSFFDKHNRSFAHLCMGDPGRGSTGVHELGTNPIQRAPLRKGIIPTLLIVEDTLAVAPDGVRQIIADARSYAAQFTPESVR